MDDNSALIKMVVILGAIMLLVSVLNPAANAAWGTFSRTVETGPSLPTFQDPRGQVNYWYTELPASNASVGTDYQPAAVHGCFMATYWLCVISAYPYGNLTSFVTIGPSPAHTNYSVNMAATQGVNAAYQVAFLQAAFVCSNNLVQKPLFFYLYTGYNNHTTPFYTGNVLCNYGDTRATVYWNDSNPSQETGQLSMADFAAMTVLVFGDISANFTVSAMQFLIGVTSIVDCTSGGLFNANAVACQIGNFVTQVVLFFALIGQGIIFVIGFLVGALAFIMQLLVGIGVGLFISFLYFFALPGAPAIVQGAIDVLFIAFLLIISFMLIRVTTGLFGGAVNKA